MGIAASGTVAAAFEPFEPPKVQGSAVWQTVSGEVSLDTKFERLQALAYLVRSDAGTRFEEGVGTGAIRGTIAQGIAKGEVRLAVQDGSVRLDKLTLRGDADLHVRIPSWNLASGPLEISGSRLALAEVRSSGSDASRRWWGKFDVPSGKIGELATAKIEATARDARPLLALLAADLPAWTRGLVNLDDLSATATVAIGPSFTRVRGLDATGGTFHIQGHYLRDRGKKDGAFLIESGALSLGLGIEPEATKVRLLGAKAWFEGQSDGRGESHNATPPSDAAS